MELFAALFHDKSRLTIHPKCPLDDEAGQAVAGSTDGGGGGAEHTSSTSQVSKRENLATFALAHLTASA